MWPFFDFQYCFRSSQSTTDLLTVASDRIARVFNRSGDARTVAFDISKAGLLHKLKSSRLSLQGLKAPFLFPHFSYLGTRIWSTRHCGLGQEVACWCQCWKNWFHLTSLLTLVLLMWKWMDLFLRKNHLLRCWGWLSLLNWIGAITLSLLLELPPKRLELWFVLWSFFFLRYSLSL